MQSTSKKNTKRVYRLMASICVFSSPFFSPPSVFALFSFPLIFSFPFPSVDIKHHLTCGAFPLTYLLVFTTFPTSQHCCYGAF
ncbi:hypothetical protein F5B17DRAFT_393146 [Nemania serpens]|nr:hypothetical protein F5B17DRAFT_393146 [Nemania serpens]